MKFNSIPDIDWIAELKVGNLQAFDTLFKRYGKRLYYFSLRYLNSVEDAEEIVQEVFLKIWANRTGISSDKSLESYLFTIARNGILNTIRKSRYERAYQNYVKINPGKNILLDEELDYNELDKAYRASIDQLSHRRKEIYLLSREQALSNAEIASRMDISVKTVENQMTAALFEIRKNLRSLGFSGLIFFELFF